MSKEKEKEKELEKKMFKKMFIMFKEKELEKKMFKKMFIMFIISSTVSLIILLIVSVIGLLTLRV